VLADVYPYQVKRLAGYAVASFFSSLVYWANSTVYQLFFYLSGQITLNQNLLL